MVSSPAWIFDGEVSTPVTIDRIRKAMSTLGEPGLDPVAELDAPPKQSALLVPIVEQDGQAALIVTKRPATMRHHRNDWVFPGGRFQAEDVNLTTTALRESEEELGLPRERTHILGQLTTRGPIITGYVISVFVGIVELRSLAPDPREIADVEVLRLTDLMKPEAYRESRTLPEHLTGPIAQGAALTQPLGSRPLHFFRVRPGEELWGTQGDILYELLTVLATTTP